MWSHMSKGYFMKTVSKFNFIFIDLWIGGSEGIDFLQIELAVTEVGECNGCVLLRNSFQSFVDGEKLRLIYWIGVIQSTGPLVSHNVTYSGAKNCGNAVSVLVPSMKTIRQGESAGAH